MKHKQTLRRGLSILLSLVLCLSLLPATALADETATASATADFTADGNPTEALALLNDAKTGTADSTWADNTLNLKGVNFTTTAETAVKLPAGAKIVLAEGTTNTIASTADNAYKSYGIYATNDLTIEGNGTLTVRSAKATTSSSYSVSYGIYADAGDITISGGTVEAMSGESRIYSCGIYVNDGNLSITGGTVIAASGTATMSYGIISDQTITISGGAVNATGGISDAFSGGICATNVEISGGTVTAKGGQGSGESYGICADEGLVEISGGHVIARTPAQKSAGTRMALGAKPDLGSYTGYYWRTSTEDSFQSSAQTTYSHDNSYTYVEFSSQNTVTTYTVTVQNDGNGSAAASPTTAAAGTEITLSATANSGYHFKEWQVISGTVAITDNKFTMPTSDVTVKAIFEADAPSTTTYTVSFDANGGSGSMDAETGVSGSYTLPDCGFTAPEGKQFKGWATSENGEVISDTSITVTDNITLYAVWEVIPAGTTYTVTFDPNGGTLNEGSHSSIKTEANGTVDYLAAAAREGYTFDGWYTEKDGGEKVYTYVNTFTDNTVLYAHWTPVAQTKQITEAAFAMKGYTVGADAKNIVVTSHTEGLSLVGGYYEAQGKPFSYVLCEASGDNLNTVTEVTGKLEAGKNYVLLVKAGVDAGYETSGLTADAVILNGTITAAECDEDVIGEACASCVFMLPVLTESDTALTTNTVTVNDSYAATTGAGEYEEGDVVTLAAGSRSDYTFSGWTSDDITIPNAGSADTSFVMPAKAVTVTANWTETGSSGSSGSSGGSGGSSGGSGFSTHTITVESAKNGAVTSSHKTASRGTTVTLTVTPDQGYELDTLTVTDGSGSKVSVTEKNGSYTFTMPASKVTVKAAFAETEEEKEQEKEKENPFVDVPKGAYYFDAVLWAAEKGVTGGTSATTFSPDSTCTRAQAVTFLWRAAGSPAPMSGANPFTDVAEGSYYYDAVLWAVQKGITGGTSATTFSPDATCTRAQIVTFLWRAQGSPAAGRANPFTDVAADAYYINAVLWAVENGITAGTGATTFSPNSDCTRAQIVTFLYRCLG